MLNNISITYFINNKRYILESKKYKNKNELIVIGEFFQILRDENIENVTLKNLREWDNKNVLPAYRITHGPIREKVRTFIDMSRWVRTTCCTLPPLPLNSRPARPTALRIIPHDFIIPMIPDIAIPPMPI